MVGWLKRRRPRREFEAARDQALHELQQLVAEAKKRGIDIRNTPPLNHDELETYFRAYVGVSEGKAVSLTYQQQWQPLQLKARLFLCASIR